MAEHKAAKVLSAVAVNKDIAVVMGEDADLFGPYKEVFDFYREYYLAHKAVPTIELVNEHFPDAELDPVEGATAHYLTGLREEFLKGRLESILFNGSSAPKKYAPQEVHDKLVTSLAGMSKYLGGALDVDVMDPERIIEDYARKRKELDENGGVAGIKTMFAPIDLNFPTGLAGGQISFVIGYAQPYSEPVLTPNGWTTMGSLQIGDEVIGSDGLPTKILDITEQGEREVYEVEFHDGTIVRCDKQHLWSAQTRKERQNGRGFKTVSLEDMLANIRYNNIHKTSSMYKWYVPLPAPIEGNRTFTVGGYLIGQLLSDGTTVRTCGLTTNDSDAIEQIRKENPGIDIRETTCATSTARRWNIYRGFRQFPELEFLRGSGASEKYIPQEFFQGTVDFRYALLRGLMDGDGHAPRNSNTNPTFATTSPRLANDVAQLVRSLGGVAKVSRQRRIYKSGNNGYVVSLRTPRNPFYIKRKASRYNESVGMFKAIRDIRPTGIMEKQRCIVVDALDSLYVTTDYTVTHNSAKGKTYFANKLAINAWKQGYRVLYVSLEMTYDEQRTRFLTILGDGEYDMNEFRQASIQQDKFKDWIGGKIPNNPGIIVVDGEGVAEVTPNLIQGKIDRYKPDLVIWDYMQLGYNNAKTQDMTPRMRQLSGELKALATRNKIHVVAISAVTDDDGKKRDAPPLIQQMAWSRAMEYDAHLVLAVHRYDDTDIVEVVCRKNRNGDMFAMQFKVDFAHGVWEPMLDGYYDAT